MRELAYVAYTQRQTVINTKICFVDINDLILLNLNNAFNNINENILALLK